MRLDSSKESATDIVGHATAQVREIKDLNKLNLLHSSKATDNPVRMIVEGEIFKDTDYSEVQM